jgi:hypothetical protein
MKVPRTGDTFYTDIDKAEAQSLYQWRGYECTNTLKSTSCGLGPKAARKAGHGRRSSRHSVPSTLLPRFCTKPPSDEKPLTRDEDDHDASVHL